VRKRRWWSETVEGGQVDALAAREPWRSDPQTRARLPKDSEFGTRNAARIGEGAPLDCWLILPASQDLAPEIAASQIFGLATADHCRKKITAEIDRVLGGGWC
jgi:hypothetical protein